jgi:hypothetical protein
VVRWALYRIVLSLAVAALLGHVCGLEGEQVDARQAVSWAQSSNTQSGDAVARHGASCDGLKPTSTSPHVALPGTRPRGASEDPIAAPSGTAWMVFPPVRCHALFMVHRAC